jgi:hypothetical protein
MLVIYASSSAHLTLLTYQATAGLLLAYNSSLHRLQCAIANKACFSCFHYCQHHQQLQYKYRAHCHEGLHGSKSLGTLWTGSAEHQHHQLLETAATTAATAAAAAASLRVAHLPTLKSGTKSTSKHAVANAKGLSKVGRSICVG